MSKVPKKKKKKRSGRGEEGAAGKVDKERAVSRGAAGQAQRDGCRQTRDDRQDARSRQAEWKAGRVQYHGMLGKWKRTIRSCFLVTCFNLWNYIGSRTRRDGK